MCHNGNSECVDARDIRKKISKGWTLGPCNILSCSSYEKLMCHDGKQACVKTKGVNKKLREPGHHWKIGACSNKAAARTATDLLLLGQSLNEIKLVPQQYKLSNYPNPFAASSTIKYELPCNCKVSIKVYDVAGRAVALLVNEDKKAGVYTVEFNATRLAKGDLYYKIIAKSKDDEFEQTNKMTRLQ